LKLETNLHCAIKSKNSEALDGRTSQLGSERGYGEIKKCFEAVSKKQSMMQYFLTSAGRLLHNVCAGWRHRRRSCCLRLQACLSEG